MQDEVLNAKKNIAETPITHEEIQTKIYNFFPPESLSYFPENWISDMISAELIYEHLISGDKLDGIAVIISYWKILDQMIELYVTKWFRKYVLKHGENIQWKNTPLEKSIRSVVEKKYILSLGRFFQLLSIIKLGNALDSFALKFSEYLKSRPTLEKCLLSDNFSLQWKRLMATHALSDKRHSGILSLKNTQEARECIVWNFSDTQCLLYILACSQSTEL